MSGRMSPLSLGMAPLPVLMTQPPGRPILSDSRMRVSARDAEGGRLPLRVVGGVEPVAHAAQHLARRGLAPEPARDVRARRVRLCEKTALPVERLEIVGRPADEGR